MVECKTRQKRRYNLLGVRFTRLTVKSLQPERAVRGEKLWDCVCDCGKTTIVPTGNLTSGNTKSCGCWNVDEPKTKRGDKHHLWKGGVDNEGSPAWAGRYLARLKYDSRVRGYAGPAGGVEAILAVLSRAGGKCEICGIPEAGGKRRHSIDHCHKTGLIRGLLCKSCKHILGNAGDSIALLYEAARYLEARSSEDKLKFKTEAGVETITSA